MSARVIGITAEYNPFHNGHRWQLQMLRETFGNVPVAACMSGWFVQRGETALADPWTRAVMAVRSGVDLVLLLPSWYSLRSADYFAAGAVKTLAATGIVNILACGAEHSSEKAGGTAASSLADTAAWSLEKSTEEQIRKLLQQGLSYGAAWETAARENRKDAGWFSGANNILALAYQKVILQHHLPLTLFPLPRQGSGYNDTGLTPPYASATAIRRALREGISVPALRSVMPDSTVTELEKSAVSYPSLFASQDHILALLLTYLLARNNGQSLYEHSSASRDLCDRFSNTRQELQNGCKTFCTAIASRRDSLPSVRRLSLQLLLQMPREFWTEVPDPCYLRVLAFNERGRGLLKAMKQAAALPVITKPGSLEQYRNTDLYPLLQLDAAAADLFRLLQGNTGDYGTYCTSSPVYVKQT